MQESDCKVIAYGSHVQRSMTRIDANVVKAGDFCFGTGVVTPFIVGRVDASNAFQAAQIRVAVSSGNGIQEG